MSFAFSSPVMKLLLPVATLLVITAIVRARGLSWQNLGAVAPPWKSAVAWTVGWIVWIALAEVLATRLGAAPAERWPVRSGSTLAILFVGMVLLAPLAEELLFRGLVYWRVAQTPAGVPGAILAGAVIFTVIHLQYGFREWLFILADGILLGLARYQSKSVWLTTFLHALGNLYAYSQRLPMRS